MKRDAFKLLDGALVKPALAERLDSLEEIERYLDRQFVLKVGRAEQLGGMSKMIEREMVLLRFECAFSGRQEMRGGFTVLAGQSEVMSDQVMGRGYTFFIGEILKQPCNIAVPARNILGGHTTKDRAPDLVMAESEAFMILFPDQSMAPYKVVEHIPD